jgi:outer membrane receptor for ferrienterochelin and colicins
MADLKSSDTEMKKLSIYISLLLLCFSTNTWAQSNLQIKVTNQDDQLPLENVNIILNKKAITTTDKKGLAKVSLSGSKTSIRLSLVGYTDIDTTLTAPYPSSLNIDMAKKEEALNEVTIVSSSRNNLRIENSPLKVEVLGQEEMTEESSIKPAGIASILGDVSGVQIQQSSAVTGNANVRIQGLDGRYTQILKDGMPLYDGFSGGFGILSIPPLDLKQVELIKGSASTLYGGGAIGGLVNIISRKPTDKQEAVLSLNQSTLKETNFNTYLAKKYKNVGYTFFGGYNYQKAVDVDGDGFSDVGNLNGVVLHPRIFFYPDAQTTITAGYTGTFENRKGGDMQVLNNNTDAVHQYYEQNKIDRNSVELSATRFLSNNYKLEFKNSLSSFNRTINNPDISFKGNQQNYFSELSLYIPYKTNSLVVGLNATGDRFKKLTDNIPLNNFSNNTIGVFAQNTWSLAEKTNIELGLRDDYQFTYGNFILPRLAILQHLNDNWAVRAGVGFGYKIPNALAPQTTDYAIQQLLPLSSGLKAEKSIGYNAEVNYKFKWDNSDIFINQAFFLTQLNNPIVGNTNTNGNVLFSNQNKAVVSKGFDTYIKATIDKWELYAGYTFTLAERKYLTQNQFIPYTPQNRFAFTIVKDLEEEGIRLGVEGSYTGKQYRNDYSQTPGYFFMAAMAEKKLGKHFSMVLNGENLFNYRQSKVESLYTGSITNPQFKTLWAPIDGSVYNLSIKWKL